MQYNSAMTIKKIGIIGCGLIGGSLAKKIRLEKPSLFICGVSSKAEDLKKKSESTCFSSIVTQISELDSDCDLVFVCLPIDLTVNAIKTLSERVQKSCIITDVASIKEKIEIGLSSLNIKHPVILGHPMAGKESTGFDVSEAKLFDGAPYFLMKNTTEAYTEFKQFLIELGLNVIETDSKEHDKIVSLSSHLPYLIASSCIAAVGLQNKDLQDLIKQSYGPGFKDTTRVAASDPKWGRAVCEDNATNIIEHLDLLTHHIQKIQHLISDKKFEELELFLEQTQALKRQIMR
jgi:prephenate dehydrogenase